MQKPITTPYAPDLREVRAWLEKMIAAMKFVEIVVAVLALIGRMRDLNTELVKRLAHLQRKRPRSETLARLEHQLVLPLTSLAATKPRSAPDVPAEPKKKGTHPGRHAPPAHLERVPVINPVPPEERICPLCGSEMSIPCTNPVIDGVHSVTQTRVRGCSISATEAALPRQAARGR
jgi:hypothetical protein